MFLAYVEVVVAKTFVVSYMTFVKDSDAFHKGTEKLVRGMSRGWGHNVPTLIRFKLNLFSVNQVRF